MVKILFVSSTSLSSKALDGKEIRALSIIKSLSKKNKVDIACIDKDFKSIKKRIKFSNKEIRFKINFFSRLLNTFLSLIKLKPLQNGYFYSKEMSNFIENNKNNYDVIIFHLIRCCQYLPSNFNGKTVLEMTDLVSVRDKQIIKNLSIINPLKYLYILERFLIYYYERRVSNKFDKIVFISNKETHEAKKFIEKKKIFIIENDFIPKTNIFKFNKKNNKIIFLGNINYLPNKLACYNFSKHVMPKINKKYPDIEFHIIGKIRIFDKLILEFNPNTVVHGSILNLKSIFSNALCGICNVKIATGFQNKILNYLSYGIPALVSKESFSSNFFKKNYDIGFFSNEDQLIKNIFKLKINKKFATRLSKNGFNTLRKKFSPSKVYSKYQKIIN